MSRDKQIEEMAKTMCFQADSCTVKSCLQVNCEKLGLPKPLTTQATARQRKSLRI